MDELGSDFLFPQGTNLSSSYDESDFNETTLIFTSTDKIDQFYDDRSIILEEERINFFLPFFIVLVGLSLPLSSAVIIFVIRYFYIFFTTWVSNLPTVPLISLLFAIGTILVSLPLVTIPFNNYSNIQECSIIDGTADKPFVVTYLTLWFISVFIDFICFCRVVNYIRKMKIQVTVIAQTPSETKLMVNIINSTSSLLIWMVTLASMIPVLISIYTSYSKHNRRDAMQDGGEHYLYTITVVLTVVIPAMIVGSSSGLRDECVKIKKFFQSIVYKMFGVQVESPRSQIYAINLDGTLAVP